MELKIWQPLLCWYLHIPTQTLAATECAAGSCIVYRIGALHMNFINCGTVIVFPEYAVLGGEAFYLILV
jgi:hypothetical protein